MVDMNADRLEKWKCLYCGSHDKHVGKITDSTNQTYMTVVVCHNCGRVDYFTKSIRHAMRVATLDEHVVRALSTFSDMDTKADSILNIDLSKYQK